MTDTETPTEVVLYVCEDMCEEFWAAAGHRLACGQCWGEVVECPPQPDGDWPTGVAWGDLSAEWFDYFTSTAFDWPPVCCDVVLKPHHTPMTHGLCTVCGLMIG